MKQKDAKKVSWEHKRFTSMNAQKSQQNFDGLGEAWKHHLPRTVMGKKRGKQNKAGGIVGWGTGGNTKTRLTVKCAFFLEGEGGHAFTKKKSRVYEKGPASVDRRNTNEHPLTVCATGGGDRQGQQEKTSGVFKDNTKKKRKRCRTEKKRMGCGKKGGFCARVTWTKGKDGKVGGRGHYLMR